MPTSKTTVSRPLVGFLTIALFGIALALSIWPGVFSGPMGATVGGACARVGVVLAALWLALPTRNRPAAWANVRIGYAAPLVLAGLALLRVPFGSSFRLLDSCCWLAWCFVPDRSAGPIAASNDDVRHDLALI